MSGTTSQQTEGQTGPQVKRYIIVVMTVILALVFVRCCHEDARLKPRDVVSTHATEAGIPTIQPTNEWSFWQVEENGRRRDFEVEVTKEEPGLLYIVVQQECGGIKRNMGGFKLDKTGDNLKGTWVNYLDQDYGEAILNNIIINSVWSGHYKLQDGSKVDCTLIRSIQR